MPAALPGPVLTSIGVTHLTTRKMKEARAAIAFVLGLDTE